MKQTEILSLRDLVIHAGSTILAQVPVLDIEKGRTHGIIGESGSGKSLTLLSILGLLSPGLRVSGSLIWRQADGSEVNLLGMDSEARRHMRGKDIGMVFQEPMTALNPQRTCGRQLYESLQVHAPMLSSAESKSRCLQALSATGLDQPERIYNSYPHQISGGQRQRVMIAMATIHRPALVLADEPTTALDPETGERVLEALTEACRLNGSSLLLVSHDISLVRKYCTAVTVMRHGHVLTQGPVKEVLDAEQSHPYVLELLRARPVGLRAPLTGQPAELVAENLSKTYTRDGRVFRALEDIHFSLSGGEALALVGFSGSGKTTVAKILTGLEKPDNGKVIFRGNDLLGKSVTGIQMVFQDPYSSLNAEMRNEDIIREVLGLRGIRGARAAERCRQLFSLTGLSEQLLDSYPHRLSGGQRQRLCIARALASEPEVLVLDEAVAALDPLVQKQVLDLLIDIQEKTGIIYIFITHNMDAATYLCHQCLVLEKGKMTWQGPSTRFISRAAQDH